MPCFFMSFKMLISTSRSVIYAAVSISASQREAIVGNLTLTYRLFSFSIAGSEDCCFPLLKEFRLTSSLNPS